MKKLYELTVRDKEELERKLQNLQAENQDLKECLDFKSNEAERLDKKTIEMAKHIQQLHEELENRAFPPELEGLSDIIKEKLGHYEL
jgi:DNA-binding PadR family transcriptional regulator